MRTFYLLFILFFLTCKSYHQTSFSHLSEAFKKWYYTSIDFPFNSHLNNDNKHFYYIDKHIINDFNEDLNRFELELSQINLNKLNSSELKLYNKINNKILHSRFKYDYLDIHTNNPVFYLDELYSKIILIDRKYTFYEDKITFINDLITELPDFLDQSKFILNKLYNLNECNSKKNEILSYLKYVLVYNDNDNDHINQDLVKSLILNADIILNNYIEWITDHLEEEVFTVDDDSYNFFTLTYFKNESNRIDFMRTLSHNLEQSFLDLFNASLNIYLLDNDEPVWVDKADTLNVIKWSINSLENNYSSLYEYNYNFDIFDSLKIESYVCDSSSQYLAYIKTKSFSNNGFDIDYHKVKESFVDYFFSNIANNDKFLFIDKYTMNALLDNLTFYTYKNFLLKKDSNLEVLFYLNLYNKLNLIYCQEMYFKGEIKLQNLYAKINELYFLSDLQKEESFKAVTSSNYMLYEYYVYTILNKDLFTLTDKLNRKSLFNYLDRNFHKF